jgi:hypothetical protein
MLSGFVPAALALFIADTTRDYAHDAAFVRARSAASASVFRALDTFAAAPFSLLPLGTPVFRASLASACCMAIAGAITYSLADRLYGAMFRPGWHRAVVAFIASLTATLSAPWLFEASAPAGSCIGAVLALAPALVLARPRDEDASPTVRAAGIAALVGIAATYEPLLGAAAAASAIPLAGDALLSKKAWRTRAPACIASFFIGVVPPAALFLHTRWSGAPVLASPFAHPLGEASIAGAGTAASLAKNEVGPLLGVLVAAGVALALRDKRSRALAASLTLVVAVGAVSAMLGAPAQAPRFAAPILAAFAAGAVLVGVALCRVVDFVANADIPFAKASAAMIILFELVLPVRLGDDAVTRRDARSTLATPLLETANVGSFDLGTAVVVSDARELGRMIAARENGELRSDLVIAPTFDLGSSLARDALATEPLLAGVYRDVALGGRLEEYALSELARARPLALSFDPSWDRALSRHLVPAGLATVFEAEPRGASDRIQRIEAFTPVRLRLSSEILPPGRDPERLHVAIKILRTRAIALGAGGERAVLAKALDDLRIFSPDDAIADKLTRRIVSAHGPIDIRDLSP